MQHTQIHFSVKKSVLFVPSLIVTLTPKQCLLRPPHLTLTNECK